MEPLNIQPNAFHYVVYMLHTWDHLIFNLMQMDHHASNDVYILNIIIL